MTSILGEAVVLLVGAADLVVDHQSLAVVRILGSLVVDYSLLVVALKNMVSRRSLYCLIAFCAAFLRLKNHVIGEDQSLLTLIWLLPAWWSVALMV